MKIQSIRSLVSARVGFDITDHYVMSYFDLDSILSNAVYCGNLDIIKYLVYCGANIHAYQNTSLPSAVMHGHMHVVKYLLSQGANIHVCDDWVLKIAVEHKQFAVVEYIESQKRAAPQMTP